MISLKTFLSVWAIVVIALPWWFMQQFSTFLPIFILVNNSTAHYYFFSHDRTVYPGQPPSKSIFRNSGKQLMTDMCEMLLPNGNWIMWNLTALCRVPSRGNNGASLVWLSSEDLTLSTVLVHKNGLHERSVKGMGTKRSSESEARNLWTILYLENHCQY